MAMTAERFTLTLKPGSDPAGPPSGKGLAGLDAADEEYVVWGELHPVETL